MKRWSVIATTGAFCIGGILLFVVNVGHWLSSPRSVPAQGDLIVALGGGGIERLQIALKLYEEGHAKRILLTGLQGQNHHHDQRWRSQFLLNRGVPSEALLFDHASANSYEEANRTAVLMKSRSWSRALVVSDPPHLRRLDMVWGRACEQHGLECRLIATEPLTWNAARWWRDKVWVKFVGMELLKLTYYRIIYGFPGLFRIAG